MGGGSAIAYWRVRILVTNDDGVHAPGLAAITRALAAWVVEGSPAEDRQVVVVAPLANHSGAAAPPWARSTSGRPSPTAHW